MIFLDRHLTTVPRRREFDVGIIPVARFPMDHAKDSETRFLLRRKSVASRHYRLIKIIIVTLSSDFVRVKVRRLLRINIAVNSSRLCRVCTTSRGRVRGGTWAARILYLIIEECFVRVGSRAPAVRA